MHIYAFGSLCRGEVERDSDADLLALVDEFDDRFDPSSFSIYSYERIRELWQEGNPFAWHLALEAKVVFASDGVDFLSELRTPSPYRKAERDCLKFCTLFRTSRASLASEKPSIVFELSTIFLSIRNFATCYSLGVLRVPSFSRNSALRLGDDSVPLPSRIFKILERSRLLSTRGIGQNLTDSEISEVQDYFGEIENWMDRLSRRVPQNG